MAKKAPTQPRGVLRLEQGRRNFRLDRRLPPDDLAATVEHFWFVAWDLTGKEPYNSETLPHPSVHLVFDSGKAEIIGVMRGRFSRRLEGKGEAFGVKFLPGAFYALSRKPLSELTNQRLNPQKVFGKTWKPFAQQINRERDFDIRTALAVNFLRSRHPQHNADALLAQKITMQVLSDPKILKVDQLTHAFRITKRRLQRLFSMYIGVNPKWVIERYRMHEAVEKLETKQKPDFARLAHALGYFDQAHFTRAFRKMTGKSPGEYVASRQKISDV